MARWVVERPAESKDPYKLNCTQSVRDFCKRKQRSGGAVPGVLQLHSCFAMRSNDQAQDEKLTLLSEDVFDFA
jgi:hypothetical protein